MLRKKWMSGLVALGVLLGASESYAVLDAEQTKLKAQITAQGLDVDDEDVPLFSSMYSKYVPLLADKWKEAQAAGMSNALIRATIGTNKNQFALDVLTAEIAQRKGPTASSVSAPLALPEKSSSTASSSSALVTNSKNADKNEKLLAQESPKALAGSTNSQSASSSSLTSGKQNPSIIGELTEEKIREAIGLPTLNLGILTAYVADFKRMLKVEMITQKTVAEILGKIRTELDDARAAGFTDEQLNDLLNRGLIYSNWRIYIKLPGKTPAKFSQVMMNRDRASAFAFFGLDEEKATISEGKQAISAYPTQKGYASLPNNRYWEEKIVFWSNLRSRDLGAN